MAYGSEEFSPVPGKVLFGEISKALYNFRVCVMRGIEGPSRGGNYAAAKVIQPGNASRLRVA
jgi:hypothetical protein